MSTDSWLDPVQATLTDLAEAAFQAGEAAGAEVLAQLASALARLQSLPDEAGAAVADLASAIAELFPDSISPAHALAPPAASIGAPSCRVSTGLGGLDAVTIRPGLAVSIRRQRIDAAGLARFLRAQHPLKPAEHAAARTGVPVDTVLKLLKRESLPMGRTMLAFIVAYGPDLLAAVLPDADARWLAGARILADQARLEAELERTRAEMAANAGRWTFCGITFEARA